MIESYSQQVRYKEPLLLFHHDGTKLANVSEQAGPAFQKMFPARGLAVGDYNNDGRVDVLDRQQRRRAGAAQEQRRRRQPLARREAAGHGLQPRRRSARRSPGRSTARPRSRYKANGGSYLSSHDMREVLGIGTADEGRLARDQVAAAERPRRALHRRARSTATSRSSKARGGVNGD